MSKLDELTEDYSRHQVPDDATVSGWRVALVLAGAMITLPIFLVGSRLGYDFGIARAVVVFAIVGIVLMSLAAATGVVAAKSRMTTWIIIQFSFGRIGAKIVASFVGITILGWYGATVDMFARAVENMLNSFDISFLSREAFLIAASLLMVAVAVFGFKGLDKLSKPAVPVMAILLVLMVYSAISAHGLPATIGSEMTIAQGASAGIGGFIVSVTMFPDICRYAKSSKDAVLASSVGFGVCIPLILSLAAVPAIATGEPEFLAAILLVGFGMASLTLLLLATWTTNAYNLYSISLVFASIVEGIAKWKLVIVAGVVGTAVALLPILDNFLYFLNFLAAMVPPIAGIYLADFFFFNGKNYTSENLQEVPAFRGLAFLAWLLGSGVGFLANNGIVQLTTVAAIDAALVGMLSFSAIVYATSIFNRSAKEA